MDTLGEKLYYLRQEEEVTQQDMAKRINEKYQTNINGAMWSKWENNKDVPSMDNMRVIAKYFNTTLDYLSGLSDVRDNPTKINKYEISKQLFQNQDLKVLFSLADDLSEEDIKFLTEMAKRMKGE